MTPMTIGFLFDVHDRKLIEECFLHFSIMQTQGIITGIGMPLQAEGVKQEDLPRLDILLLFISPHFIANDSLIKRVTQARMQQRKDQTIIPVILRKVEWRKALPTIKVLQQLPQNDKPIVNQDRDVAFTAIAIEIRKIVEIYLAKQRQIRQ